MPYSICLSKDHFKFSASHFTLFSKNRAESLHGHNYRVSLTANFKELHQTTGLAIEFSELKKIIKNLCDELDEKILLPGWSPYLRINRQSVTFHQISELKDKKPDFKNKSPDPIPQTQEPETKNSTTKENKSQKKIIEDQNQNNIEVWFNNRFYSFPEEECKLLDIVNTSSECLAHWLHKKLKTPLKEIGVQDYSISLSESQGQSVSFT